MNEWALVFAFMFSGVDRAGKKRYHITCMGRRSETAMIDYWLPLSYQARDYEEMQVKPFKE
jgi:hypothetical protein